MLLYLLYIVCVYILYPLEKWGGSEDRTPDLFKGCLDAFRSTPLELISRLNVFLCIFWVYIVDIVFFLFLSLSISLFSLSFILFLSLSYSLSFSSFSFSLLSFSLFSFYKYMYAYVFVFLRIYVWKVCTYTWISRYESMYEVYICIVCIASMTLRILNPYLS